MQKYYFESFLCVCENWSPKMGEEHAEDIQELSAEGHVL
jgi:hypothetical protein